MATHYPGAHTTLAGRQTMMITDDNGNAGWVCSGCNATGLPPFDTTLDDSARDHADICSTDTTG